MTEEAQALPTLAPKGPEDSETPWMNPWTAAAPALESVMSRVITDEINRDPREVERLRRSRKNAREGRLGRQRFGGRPKANRLFAAYVPDGIFGRFVGTAASREEAEDLVVQALDSAASGRNMSPSGGSAHHAQTAGRHDPEG